MKKPSVPSRYDQITVILKEGDTYYDLRQAIDKKKRGDDIYYKVRTGDALSTIAHRLLGDARFWWIVADFNDVVDPFVGLEEGQVLRLPSLRRLWSEILI